MVKWTDDGKHGGMEVDHKPHVWQDKMDETANNVELLKMAVEYLKSHGISIRTSRLLGGECIIPEHKKMKFFLSKKIEEMQSDI